MQFQQIFVFMTKMKQLHDDLQWLYGLRAFFHMFKWRASSPISFSLSNTRFCFAQTFKSHAGYVTPNTFTYDAVEECLYWKA